jgi:hypothetical protein
VLSRQPLPRRRTNLISTPERIGRGGVSHTSKPRRRPRWLVADHLKVSAPRARSPDGDGTTLLIIENGPTRVATSGHSRR